MSQTMDDLRQHARTRAWYIDVYGNTCRFCSNAKHWRISNRLDGDGYRVCTSAGSARLAGAVYPTLQAAKLAVDMEVG